MTIIDRAMVLAAGLGKRMRPLTDDRPKPLVELAGRTLLDRGLDHLRAAGIKKFVVNCHYKANMIETHLRKQRGIALSPEKDLLETGGGVKLALSKLGEKAFFVVNSDAVWTDGASPMINRMMRAWDDAAMDALLLLAPMPAIAGSAINDLGDYHMEPDGLARRRGEGEVAPFLFGGVQILHPRLFDGAPDGAFSLNLLYNRAQEAGRLYGLRHDGEWFHVGTPGELAEAEIALANGAASVRRTRW